MHGNLKKKFISEFIRFLVYRTGVVLFSSFLWRAKASTPRASGGGIGMRVGGIFLSIQPRACLALSARLALSSAQQKKKRNRILKKNVFETVPFFIGNISA